MTVACARSWATRCLSITLTSIIAAIQIFGQQPQEPAIAAQAVPARLSITVLEGDNAVNSISLGGSVTPVVEVRDSNEFPVEGAAVVFTLPAGGPGGTFPGNQTSLATRSDSHGQASAPFLVNGLPGKFLIKVTATSGNRTGEASITQTNAVGGYIGTAPPAKRPLYKRWYVWAIAGGAIAAILALTLTHGSSSTPTVPIQTTPPVVGVTPGPPVFGGPH